MFSLHLYMGFMVMIVGSTIFQADEAKLSASVTINLFTGEAHNKVTVTTGQCISVEPSVPSRLILSSSTDGPDLRTSHKIRLDGFSSEYCEDDFSVALMNVEWNTPVIINERIPICSFRLGKNPWPGAPLLVHFHFEDKNEPVEFVVVNDRCCDLCHGVSSGNSWRNKYPTSVQILETNWHPANNYVRLFSSVQCSDDTEIWNVSNESTKIFSGTDLVQLTKIPVVIRSFRVTEIG